MLRLLSMTFIVVPWISLRSDGEELSKATVRRIETVAQAYVDGGAINSAAIGVIDGDQDAFIGVGRFSESDDRVPNAQTIYEIGSISKVFTGIMLADAIQNGLVTADQPVQDLVPDDVRIPTWKNAPDRKITLRDLSTHVSGLPRMPNNLNVLAQLSDPYANYAASDLFTFLKAHQLRRSPGEKEEYSNLAVGLLGEVLSQQQNLTYEALLRSRITEPLKMRDTCLSLSESQLERLAPPHNIGRKPSSNWNFKALAGAGAIRSSIGDMLKFCRANLNVPDNETGKAISSAFSKQREAVGASSRPMGFGWIINPGSETRWHNGGTGGYHSILLINQKEKHCVVVLCNTASAEVDRLGSEIMTVLRGDDVKPKSFRKTIRVSKETCAKYVGTYQFNPLVSMDVAADDEGTSLTVQLTGQEPLGIYPETETLWFLKAVKADVEFTVDEDSGQCTAATLFQNGIRQKAKKVK
ncbi:MAG: serine hydrolase [Planctomycetota bacterium]